MHNISYESNVKDIELSKWPAMLVIGESVSKNVAAEILIRTDTNIPDFMFGTNDKLFANRLNNIFNIPHEEDVECEHIITLRNKLGVIPLTYINNEQIVSSFLGGPHGWCSWNGNIFCSTYNVGKWPSVEGIAEDWARIAKEFPTLTLKCQIQDREICESNMLPMIDFVISNGEVAVSRAKSPLIQDVLTPPFAGIDFNNPKREQGISINVLRSRLNLMFNGDIPQYENP